MTFLNVNGIPTDKPIDDKFWILQTTDNFSFKENDLTHEIEAAAIKLRDRVAKLIFGNLNYYHELLPLTPSWIVYAGLDSDIKVSKTEFDILTNTLTEDEVKLLYYFDIDLLIISIQDSVLQVKYFMGAFYKELNMNAFMIASKPFEPSMVMFASGLLTIKAFSFINQIFISLFSQLDYITKVCFELEHVQTSFDKYQKMKSSKVMYGDSKRITLNNLPGSVFEDTVNLRIIQTLRNEIIHNGVIESNPKIFQVFKDGQMIEKFIFLPDFVDGHLATSRSRKRFFNDETKLNEILPDLIFDFWKRLCFTIDEILK